ncbi:Uncharacterised protein [Vibrio cholerae]|nr:Uncharacterised protein [Vibrio cholerae]
MRLKNSTSNTIRRSTNLSRCVYLTASKKMKMKRNSPSPLFAQLTRFPSTSKPESMVCMPPLTTHWRIPDLSQAIRLRLISSKAT